MTYREHFYYSMPTFSRARGNGAAPMTTTSELWQRLRQARKYADLTQQDLALACGVTRGAVALWEASEAEHRTRPTTDHLIAISKRTKVPLEWLLNDTSSTESLWKLTGEFGEHGSASSQTSGQSGVPEPDVLPDLRQGKHLFVFASTPAQVSAKMTLLASEPETTRKHLILVGTAAEVHSAATPGEALSCVVQELSKNP